MLHGFLKVVISSVILLASGFANIASASLIETALSETTYDWSASCYDCSLVKDYRGHQPDDTDWTTVTGSITLSNYTIGDFFDMKALVGFTYDGPSNHVVPLNLTHKSCMDGTCLANVSGKLFHNNNFFIELTYAQFTDREATLLTSRQSRREALRQPTYIELISISDGIELVLKKCEKYADRDKYNICEKFQNNKIDNINEKRQIKNQDKLKKYDRKLNKIIDKYDRYFNKKAKDPMNVFFNNVDGEWSIGGENMPWDFGTSAKLSTVSEPSALVIFALGLIGLSFRRFKKQS